MTRPVASPRSSATPRRPYPLLPFVGFVAITAAAGWAAVAGWAPGPTSLALEPLPAPDLGIEWSGRVAFADGLGQQGLMRLLQVLTVFWVVAAATMLVSFLFRMSGRALEQRHRIAVEAALGADRSHLAARLLAAGARPFGIALAIGAGLGVAGVLWVHAAWPGPSGPFPVRLVAGAVLGASLAALLPAVGSIVLPSTFATRDLSETLSVGERATMGRFEGAARRLVVGIQFSLTLALLGGSAGVVESVARSAAKSPESGVDGELIVLPVEATGAGRDWSAVLSRLETLPTIEPESIASLGAWLGTGTRDFALAHCGVCYRGGLPVTMLGALVNHHAVSPGFFGDAGQQLTTGRDFDAQDGPGAPPVAIVTDDFARSSFQGGDAVGRELRIGDDGRWYRVIGIVEAPSVPGLGRDRLGSASVYVSLAQHPPDRAEIALRRDGALDDPSVARALESAGFRMLGPPRSQSVYRDLAVAPLRWWGWSMALVALLCLGVVVQSAYALARAEATARRREMALRIARGRARGRATAEMLKRAGVIVATAAFWAAPLATGVGAAVSRVAVGASLLSVRLYLALSLVLGVATLLGTLGPARQVARADPMELLKG